MKRTNLKKTKANFVSRRKLKKAFEIPISRKVNILSGFSKSKKAARRKLKGSGAFDFVTSFVNSKVRKKPKAVKKKSAVKSSKAKAKPFKGKIKAKPAVIKPVVSKQIVYSTGSRSLDNFLGGGIKDGSSVLILGTPHSGKKPILMNLMKQNCCKQKTQFILVLTDLGVSNWNSMAEQNGWSCKDSCGAFFVDCYSQQFNVCSTNSNVKCLDVPFSLSSVSIAVADYIARCQNEKKRPFIILHSVSSLFEMFGEEETYRFLQFFIGKMKLSNTTVVLSMQLGVHGKQVESSISSLVDCVVQFEENKISASGYISIKDNYKHPYSFKNNKLQIEF